MGLTRKLDRAQKKQAYKEFCKNWKQTKRLQEKQAAAAETDNLPILSSVQTTDSKDEVPFVPKKPDLGPKLGRKPPFKRFVQVVESSLKENKVRRLEAQAKLDEESAKRLAEVDLTWDDLVKEEPFTSGFVQTVEKNEEEVPLDVGKDDRETT